MYTEEDKQGFVLLEHDHYQRGDHVPYRNKKSLLHLLAFLGASRKQPWYRQPGWPLRSMYLVSRQSLYLLEPPTNCLKGSRLNHRLGGPVEYVPWIMIHGSVGQPERPVAQYFTCGSHATYLILSYLNQRRFQQSCVTAQEAIRKVRQRRCKAAIETAKQEDFVFAYACLCQSAREMSKNESSVESDTIM